VRLALTGTPGTGKTTVASRLADDPTFDLPVVHLNEAIREHGLWSERDEARDSLVADLDAIRAWLDEDGPGDDCLVDSHLAHHLDADRVVVLRCRPDVLETRLRERGESAEKTRENAESEALDVILAEAVERHGADAVYEIDATDRDVESVAEDVAAVRRGERDPSAGTVDFTDYL